MENHPGLLHKNIRISGRVQGVGFRYSARSIASTIGVKGYVKNLPSGDVYIEAEGSQDQMNDFIAWCHQGPVRATIRNIEIFDSEVLGFKEFIIR